MSRVQMKVNGPSDMQRHDYSSVTSQEMEEGELQWCQKYQ